MYLVNKETDNAHVNFTFYPRCGIRASILGDDGPAAAANGTNCYHRNHGPHRLGFYLQHFCRGRDKHLDQIEC